jgi:hypothetical protein
VREELMRRISTALDGDGLASDPELQKELRADPDAAKYAKDLTRVNKWLATWPLPEPDEAAFEALASRIEQRMDASLPAIADVTLPPTFEDDDALRDATVGLLESGEYRVNEIQGEPIADASPSSMPASPIARVFLEKKPVRGAVEESSGEMSGEPLSAADLELRLSLDPKPKKKKKKAPPAVPATTDAAPVAAKAAPALRVVGASDAPKAKKSDRMSIPSPTGSVAAGALAPVKELPPAKTNRPSGAWWAFAAAACVGLGVFGAATMFETGRSAPQSVALGVAATTTIAPSAATVEGATSPSTAMPLAPPAVSPVVAPAEEPAPVVAAVTPVVADPMPTPMARERQDLLAEAEVAGPRARVSATGTAATHAGSFDDADDRGALGAPRRAAPPSTTTSSTAPAPAPTHHSAARPETVAPPPVTTTTPVAPPAPTTPTPEATPPADLPDAPDRATIQAVLQGVEPAVQACGGEEHGTADVDVVIAGSGRVTTATVHGPFSGTPVGSCIARAVRGARFPAFAQPRFQVTYPFHL